MVLEDINSYDPEKFKFVLENSEMYDKIFQDHDLIYYDDDLDILKFKFVNPSLESRKKTNIFLTPRRWLRFSIFDAVPLYYLNYLTEINPLKIYDIGCGCNVFKKYIPNIIGIDVPDSVNNIIKNNADIYHEMDDSFFENNFEKFEAAFAICSLHFIPLSIIRNRVIQFSSLISKGGRGFISFNLARMVESFIDLKLYDSTFRYIPNKIRIIEIENFVREQLYDLPFKVEVFDCKINKCYDNCLNGNIRLVFTKN